MTQENFIFSKVESPLPEKLVDNLLEMWTEIFGQDYLSNQNIRPVLLGKEKKYNRDIVFLAQHKEKIIATSHLTISKFDKRIGGIGEVATDKQYRSKGLARNLCSMAIEEFEKKKGEWLFLGTSNPVAARLYNSLGWRFVPGTKVMMRITGLKSPEDFFRYYRKQIKSNNIKIVSGSPCFRLQIIPPIIFPHDEIILDYNTGIFSTRWFVQKSCMGLYPRYEKVYSDGAWFVAVSNKFVSGISSVRFHEENTAQVDGFCSINNKSVLLGLYRKTIRFAINSGACHIHVVADRADAKKNEFLVKMGCVPTNETIKIESKEGILDLVVYEYPITARKKTK